MCLHREQLLLPFLSRGEEEAPRSFCTLTLLQRDTERGRERERERDCLSRPLKNARLLIFPEKYSSR